LTKELKILSADKMRDKPKKAFSSLEYAILIAIIIAASLAMAFYIRRSLAGKWRSHTDETFGQGRQYDPFATRAW